MYTQILITGKNDPIEIDRTVDKVVLIKVGTDNRPASQKDLENVGKQVEKAIKGNKRKSKNLLSYIVTHHAVSVETINLV